MKNAIKKMWCTNDKIWISTTDGFVKSLKLEVFPELFFASIPEREAAYLYDNARSIRWEDIDLDIHISFFLRIFG